MRRNKRFVNRVKNFMLDAFWTGFEVGVRDKAKVQILGSLGILKNPRSSSYYWQEISDDFWLNVQVMEAFYYTFTSRQDDVSKVIKKILSLSEVDLGIRWHQGCFLPSGSPLLDEKLVNDVLNYLQPKKYEGVLKPFRKGLEDLLHSIKTSSRLADVVTEMYESLEALAKIVTARGKTGTSRQMRSCSSNR